MGSAKKCLNAYQTGIQGLKEIVQPFVRILGFGIGVTKPLNGRNTKFVKCHHTKNTIYNSKN